MEKIASFSVNHDTLSEGLYLSRTDGKLSDIATYDLRIVKSNTPPYLDNAGVHTFEHLFATFVRNCPYKENVIYFGPMGCLTGFYFITQNLPESAVLDTVICALQFISGFHGKIPGASKAECGNYQMHDLSKAKEYAGKMLKILSGWTADKMRYKADKENERV